jgi:tripartite-type tricarboxylate transporter receptor subunit TctC
MLNRRDVLLGLSALGAMGLPHESYAEGYPDRLIRYVVPFPPGGGVDTFARVVGAKLEQRLGQTVIIDNRPGAGGLTGTRSVAKSAPDGYSIIAASFNFLTLPVLFKNLDFDIIKDFAPITLAATFPTVLVVHPSVKATTVKEFVALSKSTKGGLRFGSSSTGGGGHIAAELLNQREGLHDVHVPYRGAAPMNIDLLAGNIDYAFAHITSIVQQVRAKQVRAIAVTSKERSPLLPEVPTMAEQGVPDFITGELHGVLFPAKTPTEIVDRVNKEYVAVLKMPDVAAKLTSQGAQLVGDTPAEFAEYIRVESEKWGKVARDAGLKPA